MGQEASRGASLPQQRRRGRTRRRRGRPHPRPQVVQPEGFLQPCGFVVLARVLVVAIGGVDFAGRLGGQRRRVRGEVVAQEGRRRRWMWVVAARRLDGGGGGSEGGEVAAAAVGVANDGIHGVGQQ